MNEKIDNSASGDLNGNLKQRLVGAGVLVALAIIFLPSLFYKEQRVAIDTTTQIPPAPRVAPVVIPQPAKPKGVDIPAPDQLFQPALVETERVDLEQPKATDKPAAQAQKAAPKPRLSAAGTPIGWVIQVASFKSQDSAKALVKTLNAKQFKAYSQAINTDKGRFYRVLVGPYIEQPQALSDQKAIDKAYKLRSRVLRFNPVSGD